MGAITSESGLVGTDIGGIDIQTNFSTIDLPQDLTKEQVQGLQYLKVAGQALKLSRFNRDSSGASRPKKGRGKPSRKPHFGKKKKKEQVQRG